MKLNPFVFGVWVLIISIGIVAYYQYNKSLHDETFVTPSDQLLLKKYSSWGPCPPQADSCYEKLEIYFSGKTVVDTGSKKYTTVSSTTIQNIQNFIQTSGIMNKVCPNDLILDYSATYTFYQSGKEKVVNFPGCEDDLSNLEKLLPN